LLPHGRPAPGAWVAGGARSLALSRGGTCPRRRQMLVGSGSGSAGRVIERKRKANFVADGGGGG